MATDQTHRGNIDLTHENDGLVAVSYACHALKLWRDRTGSADGATIMSGYERADSYTSPYRAMR